MYIKYITFISCIYFIYIIPLFASPDLHDLLKSNHPTAEKIHSLREELSRSVPKQAEKLQDLQMLLFGKEPCKGCMSSSQTTPEDPTIFAFISFSVPDSVWIALSKELQEAGGVFVIRGLPENSFSTLSKRLMNLAKQGMEAPVQINPLQFKEYEIETVPTFVVVNGDNYRKISGNITLDYALKKMEASHGK